MRETSLICVGRDRLCAEVVESASRKGSVLLLGGRQAGKSTVLRKIAETLGRCMRRSDELASVAVPVYVDLMRLPHDAEPADFFESVVRSAAAACGRQIVDFDTPEIRTARIAPLDTLIANLNAIAQGGPGLEISFVFLLDESKRVLGNRFPRGFQDNLFAWLYGDVGISSSCSIVFAGGQELYGFCEDDTSPIGSRAAKCVVGNIGVEAVAELVQAVAGPTDSATAQSLALQIFGWTGGHAGLTAQLVRALRDAPGSGVDVAALKVRSECSELLTIWRERLSREARAAHDELMSKGRASGRDIARALTASDLDPYKSERAIEELAFTGIGTIEADAIVARNQMYRDSVQDAIQLDDGSDEERATWTLIKETELALRRLVGMKFVGRWAAGAEQKMRAALGDQAWSKVVSNREQAVYPRSREPRESNILDFLYLGQLGTLMVWGGSWEIFKIYFRDRRELEDLLAAIVPVRNDEAHFRHVPEKELSRCRVASDDLLAVIERALLDETGGSV